MDLNQLLRQAAEHSGRQIHIFDQGGTLESVTFGRLVGDVENLARELGSRGLGDRSVVGLVGPNSYQWIVADLALQSLRCISACIPEHMLSQTTLEEVAARYELDCLLFTTDPGADGSRHSWCGVVGSTSRGIELRAVPTPRRTWSSDVLTLVFSSGTTGNPKCLIVSKAGLENTIELTSEAWRVESNDNIFVTLPFSNLQQRWMLYMALWFGFDVSLAPPERLYRALRRMAPTILLGPPAFFEEAEKRFDAKATAYKFWRVPLARLAALLPAALGLRLKRALFPDLHSMFGGKMRLMFVGSAPTRRRMLATLQLVGLPIFEVYGLTEFGWISFNLPKANSIGSVGRPVKGVTVSIAQDRQVIVEGTSVQTLGYAFGREEELRAVFPSPNRVTTGDTGYLDPTGFLHLDGRLKNIIATRGGLKMNPETIEAKIEELACVSRAVVFGGGDLNNLVCVAFVKEPVEQTLEARVTAAVEEVSRKLSPHERIGRVVVRSASALTEQSGMLTRNLKLNRSKILEVYRDAVV